VFALRLDVHYVSHKSIGIAVIPHDLRMAARPPLEHASRLPAPCTRLAQFNPAVAILRVNHTYFDNIIQTGAAVFEISLHSKDVSVVLAELKLVIIAKPVERRRFCDCPDRGQTFLKSVAHA
jgi:hypothetical protein